jgi:hypothetical protein
VAEKKVPQRYQLSPNLQNYDLEDKYAASSKIAANESCQNCLTADCQEYIMELPSYLFCLIFSASSVR